MKMEVPKAAIPAALVPALTPAAAFAAEGTGRVSSYIIFMFLEILRVSWNYFTNMNLFTSRPHRHLDLIASQLLSLPLLQYFLSFLFTLNGHPSRRVTISSMDTRREDKGKLRKSTKQQEPK